MTEYAFFCGVAPHRKIPKNSQALRAHGADRNIALDPLLLNRRLATTISPRLLDLIDVGAYVFAADRITSRGGSVSAAMGREWRRRLKFTIAVRDPAHWSQPELMLLLQDALGFISEDDFAFEFVLSSERPPEIEYFQFHDDPVASGAIAPVVLFSGGLDSLAGTLVELQSGRRRVVLVSHQSSSIVTHHQNELVADLVHRFPNRILHLPVKIKLEGLQSRERSQRTRTFLFSCIAGAVAATMGAPGIRFYENGIMSLNLPLSAQVVGTSATRSTHPRTLTEMALFLEAATGNSCGVDNPFVLMTKAEVMQTFTAANRLDLIDLAYTCTEVRRRGGGGTHCGACIQCLHRRFGALAAGVGEHDKASKYSLDLFESPREGRDLTMLADLVRRARQFDQLQDIDQFFSAFPLELARLRGTAALGPQEQAVQTMFELHCRFGNEVVGVIEQGLERFSTPLSKGMMAPGSLLTFVVGEQIGRRDETPRLQGNLPVSLSPASKPIELMIDVTQARFSINGRKSLRGKRSVEFLSRLADQHREDARREIASENISYVPTTRLTDYPKN